MKRGDRVKHVVDGMKGTVDGVSRSGKSAWVRWDGKNYSTQFRVDRLFVIDDEIVGPSVSTTKLMLNH